MNVPPGQGIFNDIPPDVLQRLFHAAQFVQLKKGNLLIQEGMEEQSFYYILSGEVKIFKHTDGHDHLLAKLTQGETVGELALIDKAPRSTSVECLTDCTVYQFDINQLTADPQLKEALQQIKLNIGQQMSNRLRQTNDVAVSALKNKFVMSIFSIRMLILFSIYALSLNLIEQSKAFLPNTTLMSLILIIICFAVVFSIIRQSGYPLKFYGVTGEKWLAHSIEAIGYSLPIMLIIVLIKWWVINHMTNLEHFSLFDPTAMFNQGATFNLNVYLLSMLMYALFCPVQEFIVRGCVQTSLISLLEGSKNAVKWNAIIISNLIFASAHSHTSLGFALTAFVPGIFWGWLFYRQKSLVGVSISHILIGVWAVFIVGFENLF